MSQFSKVKTIPVEASSDDPNIQAAIDEAKDDLEHLSPTLNRVIENISAGGIKRIVKALVTFQDVKFKGDEYEAMHLTEHLLLAKMTILLSAARNSQLKEEIEKQNETETVKGEETNGV